MLLGTAVGVLPGIGPAMTVALLLPVTYNVSPSSALIMFAGIYYGGMYGGSTTSILLNTPGESSSVITAIEGNKMAKAGRAAQALATAAIGSFVAGTIGTACWCCSRPRWPTLVVQLGAPSYFAMMLLALLAVTAVLGDSRLRGFIALFLGLAIGLVGTSTGQPRLTFGQPLLADGIDIVVVAVAIFAVGEALWVAAHLRRKPLEIIPVGRPWMSRADWGRSWKPWLRGTAFGFPFGALPAGGAEIPTFLSYVDRAQALQAPRGVRQGRDRGRRRAGGRQQRLRRRHPGAAARDRPADDRDRRGDPAGDAELRHPARTAAVRHRARAGLDAAGQPVRRQHPAAGAQPAAGAGVGAGCCRSRGPYLYAGILFFASLGAYSVNFQAFDLAAAAGVRPARSGDAAVRAAGAAADHRRHPRPARSRTS